MREKKRRSPWLLTWLTLVLTVPAWAQVAPVGEQRQPLPEARWQVTQTLSIAVCGESCNCGAGTACGQRECAMLGAVDHRELFDRQRGMLCVCRGQCHGGVWSWL